MDYMAFVFGTSTKGKRTLIYKNYEYVKECANVNGTVSWRCRFVKKFKCKARLVSLDDRVVAEKQPEHTHGGNIANSLARKAVGEMKEAMGDLMATPSASQASVSATLSDDVLMALPKRATLSRALQRTRQKVVTAALPAIPTDLLFAIPAQFTEMVLYDSGPGDDRLLIMGCNELLDGLARAQIWLADGTFKVVPSLFFQLYSLHFSFGNGINPAGLYGLLVNKTGNTYERFLREVQRLIPLASPRTILVDFEKAAMNSFAAVYPLASVTGCYFHLCQSVNRKVNEVGLKVAYESNNEVRGFVRCLTALAFVPPNDVEEAFELLAENSPQDIEHLDELTTFFEHTYIRGRRHRGRGEIYGAATFAIPLWNQHAGGVDGIARTTNSVEGWHHGLQSLFLCHHPTLWSFMKGLQLDMIKQKTVFLQATTGTKHLSSRAYRLLNERVKRAVAAYGRAEILTYVRSIAYLSHA